MPLSDFDEGMQTAILNDLVDVYPDGTTMNDFWQVFEKAQNAFRFNASYLTGSGLAENWVNEDGDKTLRITAKGIDHLRAQVR